jgi:hypothetical protein
VQGIHNFLIKSSNFASKASLAIAQPRLAKACGMQSRWRRSVAYWRRECQHDLAARQKRCDTKGHCIDGAFFEVSRIRDCNSNN